MTDQTVAYETRTVVGDFEMRDDATTGAPTLSGYAATFNQEYDLGPFREQIDPAAFRTTLRGKPDVRLLVDHEGQPLARTKSGTLDLSPDSTGLQVRATLDPSDPDVQRLLPKMRRGDLDQMSFAFRVPAGGDEWDHSGKSSLRTLREINLQGGDVSVVTYPANPATSATVRAADENEARLVFVEAMAQEMRSGHPIGEDNQRRLREVIQNLTSTVEERASDAPYGDVTYADPGYQDDGKKRYPLDTEAHVRAAWSYINQSANQTPYTAEQLASIKSKIKSAAGKYGIEIDSESNSARPTDLAMRLAAAQAMRHSAA